MDRLNRYLHNLKDKIFGIKRYINGVHYTILDGVLRPSFVFGIKIIRGPYKNNLVGFETVISDEDVPGLTIRCGLINPMKFDKDFTNTKKWYTIATQIFEDEYRNALGNYNRVKKELLEDEADDLGNDYFEEPVEKRTVYKKGSSVSKKRVFSQQKRKNPVSGNERLHSKVQPPTDHGSDTDIFSG